MNHRIRLHSKSIYFVLKSSLFFVLLIYCNLGMLYICICVTGILNGMKQLVLFVQGTWKPKMLKISVSLPRYVFNDLRRPARIKGMTSYPLSKTGYSFCQVYLILMVSRNGIFDKGEGVLILMPSFVNVHQAKTQFSKLLKQAHLSSALVSPATQRNADHPMTEFWTLFA